MVHYLHYILMYTLKHLCRQVDIMDVHIFQSIGLYMHEEYDCTAICIEEYMNIFMYDTYKGE